MNNGQKQKIVVVSIACLLAVGFILGAELVSRKPATFYQSYFADIAIPFLLYFLLYVARDKTNVLKSWWVKALIAFGLCAVSEILQFFGIPAFARVFDPVDFIMYFAGTSGAVVVDRLLFCNIFRFWE